MQVWLCLESNVSSYIQQRDSKEMHTRTIEVHLVKIDGAGETWIVVLEVEANESIHLPISKVRKRDNDLF